SYIRALFNDSYEVDDARGQSNWTADLFEQFKKRRGYDLRNYLPALLQRDKPEINSRVIFDYRTTIDELILENFTIAWKKWGDSKGAIIRNQSHGSPANLLDLYGAIDIPETEGDDILRFKFATSAGHVTGKRLISSESATWLNEHFLSNWGDVKKKLDLFFLGGVNHIFYHGVNYSPEQAPWPGWLFYAAVHFQPTNPMWKDFDALNNYVARVQSFLQGGGVDNDVLLYCPINDRYADPGRALLQHFDNMEHEFRGTDFANLSAWMQERGYSFDFFSDRQLQKMSFAGNKILSSNNAYQTILLPANKYITVASFKKLLTLAKAGATILVFKNMPQEVPGLSNADANRKTFESLLAQLNFTETAGIKKAAIGKGAFLVSDDMNALANAASVRKENLVETGLSFIRRKNGDGHTYFINNRTDKPFNGWVPIKVNAASVALFNPQFEKSGLAKWRKNDKGSLEVWVQLQSFESCILQTFNTAKKGTAFSYYQPSGDAQPLNGSWTIDFISGGPVLPKAATVTSLGSWTDMEGDDVKNFSGTAKYSTTFSKPAGNPVAWQLDLGTVDETAEIILNGKRLATLIGPSYKVVIPAAVLKETNRLEVVVANLMANRISYMDRNSVPWKIFYNINMPARRGENSQNGLFNASKWKPFASGLTGPVTLTPLGNQYE
ncbi:MAG TPA: glycosyl hydrolase, partial [Flavisolibacter sp.]|nr:glycosyl hydrolase [Flavisolibacter sp.]